jgi:hypothetical protein
MSASIPSADPARASSPPSPSRPGGQGHEEGTKNRLPCSTCRIGWQDDQHTVTASLNDLALDMTAGDGHPVDTDIHEADRGADGMAIQGISGSGSHDGHGSQDVRNFAPDWRLGCVRRIQGGGSGYAGVA